MCGIVGWISQERAGDAHDRRRFLEQALIIDTLRGDDSTGVFSVPCDGYDEHTPTYWLKNIVDGYRFVAMKEYQEAFTYAKVQNLKFVVGHNRSATVGSVTTEAAHPFSEGPITLVHNGTLNETVSLGKSMTELGAENDSHAICHNLAISPVETVISQLNGAFALVWHDRRDDSLNMIRNSQRPLHMAKSKRNNTIYFASEGEMLYLLSQRLHLDLDCIVMLKPGFLLKFRGPDLMVPQVQEMRLFTQPAPYTVATRASWHRSTANQTNLGTTYSETNERAKNATRAFYDRLRRDKIAKRQDRLIPEHLELDLCDLDMDPEMEFNFVPMDALKIERHNTKPTYTVFGRLLGVGNRIVWGMVHRIEPHVWEKGSNRLWTVSPLGQFDQGWDNYGVVCRLRKSIGKDDRLLEPLPGDKEIPWPTGNVEPRKEAPKPPKEDSKSDNDVPFDDSIAHIGAVIAERLAADKAAWEEDEDEEYERMGDDDYERAAKAAVYPGPGGRSVDFTEWTELTEPGCIGCGQGFALGEAWNIKWVNNGGRDPLCFHCQVEEGHEKAPEGYKGRIH